MMSSIMIAKTTGTSLSQGGSGVMNGVAARAIEHFQDDRNRAIRLFCRFSLNRPGERSHLCQ